MNSDSNEKKYNKIAYRIVSIQDMVKDKEVESIVPSLKYKKNIMYLSFQGKYSKVIKAIVA